MPFAWIALLAAMCAACSSTPDPSRAPDQVPAASAIADPTDCQARIERASFEEIATIDRVEECRFTEGGIAAAGVVLTAGGSRDAIWSALWIYDAAAADPVRPYLHHESSSIRVMAAVILASLGEREALDELTRLTDDEGTLLGSHPPLAVGEFAIRSLARLVSASGAPAGDVDEETLAASSKVWQGWMAGPGAQLRYDAATAEWSR